MAWTATKEDAVGLLTGVVAHLWTLTALAGRPGWEFGGVVLVSVVVGYFSAAFARVVVDPGNASGRRRP